MYLIAIVTLLLSAFFSGIEIAFVSANKLQLEVDKNTGKFPSNIISYFSKNESDFITTMLVGNNIALVIYGVMMTRILTPFIEIYFSSSFELLLIQTIIATVIVLVVAEFLPKAIFRVFPNKILKIFSVPIWISFILLRPIAILMLNISEFILHTILRQRVSQSKQVFGKTDLGDYLSQIKSKDGIEENRVEVEMLKNALYLTDKKIRDCMIPRTDIVAMNVNSSIAEIKNKFIETKLSKILIFKGSIDNVIGYIHSLDLFRGPRNIRSVLLPLPFVPETMPAMQLLNQFIDNNKGIALVVDEFGGTSGMLTIEDVTEEIVGEIVDEHDLDITNDIQISDNIYALQARLEIDLLNKTYNLNLPESDQYKTIAGLLLHHQENIPKKEDVVIVDNFKFIIKEVNQNTIQKVELEILSV